MNLLIDIGIILIIVALFLQGMKKGIVRTVFSLLNVLISAIIAGLVSNEVSKYIYNSFIENKIYTRILEELNKSDLYTVVTAFFNDLPESIVNILAHNNISEAYILSSVNGSQEDMANAISNMLAPIFILVISVFVTIILFFVILILLNLILKTVLFAIRIPVLTSFDSLLGGVAGLVLALCIVYLIVGLLNFSGKFIDAQESNAFYEAINNSYLINFFNKFNPFTWIFEK